jgi:secretion/DNA translocation related CpaE-like protein
MHDHPPAPARPVIATGDERLLDDLLRLCAAAGIEPEVAHDAAAARRIWGTAPLIVIGDDLTGPLLRIAPERRPGVVLVGRDMDDADVWQRAVALGAEHVVFLPDAEDWLVGRIANIGEHGSPEAAIICVLGGRGGAGASTLAAALAVTALRRGLRAMLIDGDPLGGGIDMILGGEGVGGLRWPDLASTRGRVNANALAEALPKVNELTVLSWDRGDMLTIPAEAMRSVLDAARRGRELVVVDLPRRLDTAVEEALTRCSAALLVVPAEVRATAGAARVAALVGPFTPNLRIVVRGPAPSGLSAITVAEAIGLPLAGEMRAEPGVAVALERGEPPARRGRGPLAEFCTAFLDTLIPHQRGTAA